MAVKRRGYGWIVKNARWALLRLMIGRLVRLLHNTINSLKPTSSTEGGGKRPQIWPCTDWPCVFCIVVLTRPEKDD
jgi:hypothetical protein